MRDVENYLGYKAYTAQNTTLSDLTGGTGNFDFGDKGQLGFYPDAFIKAHPKSGAQVAADVLGVSIQDSADGTTYAEIDYVDLDGVVDTTTYKRIKLPIEHKRFIKVQTKFTTAAPSTVTWEFYLERG